MVWVTPIASLLALVASGCLSLSEAKELDVYNAPIIYPTESTVWRVGEKQHVEWNTTDMPANTSPTALVLFHKKKLNYKHPLATNFDYHKGEVNITVPYVTPGAYQLVLMGDSGNLSPVFEIQGSPVT